MPLVKELKLKENTHYWVRFCDGLEIGLYLGETTRIGSKVFTSWRINGERVNGSNVEVIKHISKPKALNPNPSITGE